MRGYSVGTRRLGWLIAAWLVTSLLAGCLADTNEAAKGRRFINAALARKIDEQLGPVDRTDPLGGPLSHLGINLKGKTSLETLITYLRLVQDTSLKQLSAASPAGLVTAVDSPALASPLAKAPVDSNPCTEDKDNDGDADFADLCLGGRNEARCAILTPREFQISFSDCHMPDPAYRYYLVHYDNTTAASYSNLTLVTTDQVGCTTVSSNCFTGTSASLHQVSIVNTSTAYWNVNGSVTFHNGVGGVNEQTIEITYHRLHFELHDFLQLDFKSRLDLDNADLMLQGRRLVYRVLNPDGSPALGTTGLPDGMDIFDVDVNVDDDGYLPVQAPGKYRLRLAMDWEDGLVFLHKTDAVLPSRPAFPVAPGSGTGVSYTFTFYDRDHLWEDGAGTGCQVQVQNVDETTRTFDIMAPGSLTVPCPDIGAKVGVEY